jgi:hypothetical protein
MLAGTRHSVDVNNTEKAADILDMYYALLVSEL